MPYRRTEHVTRKLAARHSAILAAAGALAAEGGLGNVQIATVAGRAGIAAGTVYRYFPAKIDLIAALVSAEAAAESAALEEAGNAAPGPLSALAATIASFAARELDAVRSTYRQSLLRAFETRIRGALERGHLPDQDARAAAAALMGALVEGLVGPLAPPETEDPAAIRARVQTLTLFGLRGLGVIDARARGLVVQTALPR